ncbi:MAG: hypothetical protein EOO62_00610 [Hymenobacter sp.]|nr:MAG: hypothetical protein EOO62_00610 [Hymenobacter sp.]
MINFFPTVLGLAFWLPVSAKCQASPPARSGTIQLLLDNEVVASQRMPLPAGARGQVYVGVPYPGAVQAAGPVRVRVHTVGTTAFCIGSEFSTAGQTVKYRRRSQVSYPQLDGASWQTLNAQLKQRYLALRPAVFRLDDVRQVTVAEYKQAGFPVESIFPANNLSVNQITVFTRGSQVRLLCFANDESEQVDRGGRLNRPGCGDSLYLGPLYYAVRQQRFVRPAQVLQPGFQRQVQAFARQYLAATYHLTPAEQRTLALTLAYPASVDYVPDQVNGLVLDYCQVELKPGIRKDLAVVVSKELAAVNMLE